MTFSLILGDTSAQFTLSHAATTSAGQCLPTAEDEMGPLYKAGAPLRNSVGVGYLLMGKVRSAADCALISGAKIEIWLAGPDGLYGDDWRATLFSSTKGTYHFQSHAPPNYGTGRAHIHLKVTADNFKDLITQHYPITGAGEAIFDLNLVPAKQ